MNKYSLRLAFIVISIVSLPVSNAAAQSYSLPPNTMQPFEQNTTFTQEQLDQLLAPIALYPDQLVAQVLIQQNMEIQV